MLEQAPSWSHCVMASNKVITPNTALNLWISMLKTGMATAYSSLESTLLSDGSESGTVVRSQCSCGMDISVLINIRRDAFADLPYSDHLESFNMV